MNLIVVYKREKEIYMYKKKPKKYGTREVTGTGTENEHVLVFSK